MHPTGMHSCLFTFSRKYKPREVSKLLKQTDFQRGYSCVSNLDRQLEVNAKLG